jgi:hypothetical protein
MKIEQIQIRIGERGPKTVRQYERRGCLIDDRWAGEGLGEGKKRNSQENRYLFS